MSTAVNDEKPSAMAIEAVQVANGNKRKRQKTSDGDDSSPVDPSRVARLLQCLPRAQLESLISTSVQTKIALTLRDLEEALPENIKWKAKPASTTRVSTGPSRVGTGLFDCIDGEIMQMILLALPLQDRMVCVTRVCKSWRDYKKLSCLWEDLTAFRPRSKQNNETYIRAEWILNMLDWLPSPENITAITIPSTKTCNTKTCKDIIKKLVTLKSSDPPPKPLAKLVVSGPQISPAVFTALGKSHLVGPGLESLVLTNDVKESKLADIVPDLLQKCRNLCELKLPCNSLGDGRLQLSLNRLWSARGNNPTLLQVLDLTGSFCYSSVDEVSVNMLSSLATSCPELEVLKLHRLFGLPLRDFPDKHSREETVLDIPDSFLAVPMQPLHRLKTFHVEYLHEDYGRNYTNSFVVRRLLSWLFAGMPALENLHFSNGSYYLSTKAQKRFRYPGYPSLGHGLATLPRSIQRLELDFLMVDAADFESLSPEVFPHLQHVQLYYCGPAMLNSVSALSARFYSRLTIGVRMAETHDFGGAKHRDRKPQLAQGLYDAVVLSSIPNSGSLPGRECPGFVALVEEASDVPHAQF